MPSPRLLTIWILSIVVALTAAEDKPGYRVIDWSAAPPGQTGESRGELKDPQTGSLVMRYQAYAPAALPAGRTLGLIVGFHGLGGNEAAAQGAYWPMKALGLDQDYVFIGGKSTGNGWELGDEDRLMQFIDWAETVYPIDHRRVFFWGHSNGGWAVGNFGSRHADRIAGIVRWSGYGVFVPPAKNPVNTMTEFYLVHGDADPTVNVSGSRNYHQALLAQNHRYVYREVRDGDHGNILSIQPISQDAARWVHFLRHKTIPPPAEDTALLKRLFKAKDSDVATLLQPDTWDDLVRIGAPCTWPIVAKAVKSKDPAVRLSAAQACARTAFAPDEAVAALTKLAEDDDDAVRQAAIAALGVHANWRSGPAQLALARLALNAKKVALADRSAAATALAAALPLPFHGNFADDAIAFEGIVALLGADELSLREIAFAPLKATVTDGLGYDPTADAAARRRPIAEWQAWFASRTAAATKGQAKR